VVVYFPVFVGEGLVMRWFWVALGTLGFIIAWTTKSPGLMGFGLLLGLGSMFCAVIAFAAARIAAGSRPDAMMISPEELMQMRKRAEAQRAAAGDGPAAAPVARTGRPPLREEE
jgi:hypothetical protein